VQDSTRAVPGRRRRRCRVAPKCASSPPRSRLTVPLLAAIAWSCLSITASSSRRRGWRSQTGLAPVPSPAHVGSPVTTTFRPSAAGPASARSHAA
jgi:hypothetical protein